MMHDQRRHQRDERQHRQAHVARLEDRERAGDEHARGDRVAGEEQRARAAQDRDDGERPQRDRREDRDAHRLSRGGVQAARSRHRSGRRSGRESRSRARAGRDARRPRPSPAATAAADRPGWRGMSDKEAPRCSSDGGRDDMSAAAGSSWHGPRLFRGVRRSGRAPDASGPGVLRALEIGRVVPYCPDSPRRKCMEFGLFIQGFVPGEKSRDPRAEHAAFMNEADLCVLADRHNWKYVWVTEHHALTEYSHISANDVFLGYLARATERLHIGSGIFNLSPRVNHPVRNAERAAMLDQLTAGPLRVRHRPRRRLARGRDLQHPRPVVDQGRVGRGGARDPAHVEADRLHVQGQPLRDRQAAQHAAQAVRAEPSADVGRVRQPADLRQGGQPRASARSASTSRRSAT